MRQAPFYKIYIGKDANEDISELVESFTYEDAIEEDSLLKITIKSDYSLSLADDPRIRAGAILVFNFGFIQGQVSELHKARVTDIKHKYRDRVTMEIIALDIGTTVRKVQEQVIWKRKTSVEIAQALADKWGLDLNSDPTTKVWDVLPQGNKSDMDLLRYLAQREDGGNYIAYIRNNILNFVKRSTDKESVRTYTYGDGDGVVMYFEPTIKESSQQGSANKAVVATFNPFKGEYKPQVVDNATESKTGTLGSAKPEYVSNPMPAKGVSVKGGKEYTGQTMDLNGAKVKVYRTPKPQTVAVDPTTNIMEAANLGNAKKKAATIKTLVAKLGIVGNPLLVPNNIITMKGVAKIHSGNWWVHKVTHTIQGQGFVTVVDLGRNGVSKPVDGIGGVVATDANKSVGAETQGKKVKVNTVIFGGAKGKFER